MTAQRHELAEGWSIGTSGRHPDRRTDTSDGGVITRADRFEGRGVRSP